MTTPFEKRKIVDLASRRQNLERKYPGAVQLAIILGVPAALWTAIMLIFFT